MNFAIAERQRKGRNKSSKINKKYINSGKYRKKFDKIVKDRILSRLLYKCAKDMLVHRSGTMCEDMYWIDIDSISIIAKEINCRYEKEIKYSNKTKKAIKKFKKIVTMHSHPDSFPPSIYDFNSNFEHNYQLGIVICHNGKVYIYDSNQKINKRYYELVVASYLKTGNDDETAQLKALAELERSFDIKFKEVR